MVMDQISSAKMRFWNDAEHWKQMCFHHKKEFFLFFFGTKTKQEAFQRFENMIRFYWLLVENPKSATSCIDW